MRASPRKRPVRPVKIGESGFGEISIMLELKSEAYFFCLSYAQVRTALLRRCVKQSGSISCLKSESGVQVVRPCALDHVRVMVVRYQYRKREPELVSS
jgi:hypothetical protein